MADLMAKIRSAFGHPRQGATSDQDQEHADVLTHLEEQRLRLARVDAYLQSKGAATRRRAPGRH